MNSLGAKLIGSIMNYIFADLDYPMRFAVRIRVKGRSVPRCRSDEQLASYAKKEKKDIDILISKL